MKKIKKILALFLSAIFVFTSVVNAADTTYVYRENNIEIQITHAGLSEEKLHLIVYSLTSEEPNAQTYGLMCTLFGHKLVVTSNKVVTHMVYDTYPHCKLEYYQTTLCERNNCNYAEIELLSVESVGCCVP